MHELAPGIRHWTAVHPKLGIEVSSYWLPGLSVLLDPIAVPDEVYDVDEIILSNRHHQRDALEARERLGATVRAPRVGQDEFDASDPVEFFEFGEALAGGEVTPHQVTELWPDDCVLHIPSLNTLAIADTVVHYNEELEFVPEQFMDDPEAEKRDICAGLARLAEQLDFEHLLVAHGDPIMTEGRERLLAFARP